MLHKKQCASSKINTSLRTLIQKIRGAFLLLGLSLLILRTSNLRAQNIQSQDGDHYRYILFNAGIDFMDPEGVSPEGIKKFMDNFNHKPESEVKVGLNVILSYLHYDIKALSVHLEEFLKSVEKTDTPVMIKLDGEQWWGGRPELWNWWDPEKPGYNPENRKNVEWTSWDKKDALKIAWRNWGRQIRVLPPPNLMSPAYRKECHKAMDVLLPIIFKWWKSLPEDKKYLLAGITVGWESSIGVNAYYYPNGNELLDKPEEDDPKLDLVRGDVLSRGVAQIGYASVKTTGIRENGDITEEDLVEVVRRHLKDLSKHVYEAGFPREKIFTHGWGNEFGEEMYDAAVNQYSSPGWSNYWTPEDVSKNEGIMWGIRKSDARHWAVVEWLLMESREKKRWENAIENTLFYPGCKSLIVYNWASVKDSPQVMEAVNRVIAGH